MPGMGARRRAGWTIGGVLAVLLVAGVAYRLAGRSWDGIALSDTSVVVTARLPTDAFFPVEFLIANDFQPITDVRVSCIVDRYVTDAVDLVDTDTSGREMVPALARGAQRSFSCPAPAELPPPFPLSAVRRAHVIVDVVFSVPGRWKPLGVRQGFDLVSDPVRRPFWQAAPPVLTR
jgi:hypothetical protein